MPNKKNKIGHKSVQPNIETLRSSESKWSVHKYSSAGAPMLVRINDSALEWTKHPELSTRVGFAIPLNIQNTSGLADPDENLMLNAIEDGLCEMLENACHAIQALAITAGTFKEYVFYISNPSIIESVHKMAIAKFTSHKIQCMGQMDPNWDVYFQFKKQN